MRAKVALCAVCVMALFGVNASEHPAHAQENQNLAQVESADESKPELSGYQLKQVDDVLAFFRGGGFYSFNIRSGKSEESRNVLMFCRHGSAVETIRVGFVQHETAGIEVALFTLKIIGVMSYPEQRHFFIRQFADGIDSGELQARFWDSLVPISDDKEVPTSQGKLLTGQLLVTICDHAFGDEKLTLYGTIPGEN